MHNPEILFLDEPTSGLDIMSARKLREIISGLSKQGVTIFLTTHYIEEAGVLCDRIAIIVKGEIVEIDTSEGLKKDVQDIPILRISIQGKINETLLDEIFADDVSVSDGQVSIYTNDLQASLESFLNVITGHGMAIQNVETIKPKLEDAFIQLTGISLDSMGEEKEGKR